MRQAEAIAVGVGALSRESSSRVTAGWNRAVTGGATVKRPATPAQLAAIGIGYVKRSATQKHV